LDRQRRRLDALVFVRDVDRRQLAFFGTLLQDPESDLVPAERNPRPGFGTGDPSGFEGIATLLDPTFANDLMRISLGGIRVEFQVATIEGLIVQRDRPGDGYAPHAAAAHHGGQSESTKDGQRKPSAPNSLRCHY